MAPVLLSFLARHIPVFWRAALGNPEARLMHGKRLAAAGRAHSAFRQFARAARAGLAAAQYQLGHCYLMGLGVAPNLATALHWLGPAAAQGDSEAQTTLASLALQGMHVTSATDDTGLFGPAPWHDGEPPDYTTALHWAERAAAGGSAAAQALLGYILTSGPADLRDAVRGAACYRAAAEAGDAHGKLGWALLLLAEPTEETRVRTLLVEAAAAGIAAAHYVLGTLEARSDSMLAMAVAHYRTAAELGHRAAQFRYGLALLNGRGVAADPQDGETWLRRAALGGDALAAAVVGDLYARTGPLPPNYCEAGMWFQRAAEAGHAGAARALGQLYLRGSGFGADPETAVRWLRMAAEAGEAEAAYDLALCLVKGAGTPRDDAEALVWLRRAATAGYAPATEALVGTDASTGPVRTVATIVSSFFGRPWVRYTGDD